MDYNIIVSGRTTLNRKEEEEKTKSLRLKKKSQNKAKQNQTNIKWNQNKTHTEPKTTKGSSLASMLIGETVEEANYE